MFVKWVLFLPIKVTAYEVEQFVQWIYCDVCHRGWCLLLLVYLYLYVKHQTSSKYAVNEKVHREVKVNDINMSQYSLLTLCCLQGGNSVEG